MTKNFTQYLVLLCALFVQGQYAFGVRPISTGTCPSSLAAATDPFAVPRGGDDSAVATSKKAYNPSIYGLTDHMLDSSLLMYPIAQIRKFIRENPDGQFKNAEKLLATPITASDLVQFLIKNKDEIKKAFDDDSQDLSEVSEILETVVERQKQKEATPGEETYSATLVEFDDDESNSELVYAVTTNDARKSVTVSFRGSVTPHDWLKDLQISMKRVANPLSGRKGVEWKTKQPENIRIHRGFYTYLYQYDEDTKTIKYEEIMEVAMKELRENPGYKLYVTGHSLGAALASLFAFMVAASEKYWDEIPDPITCVSIASPYVGGSNFRTAFQELERSGRLRYLRVANQGDIVSIEPFVALNFGFYKHNGMEFKLYRFNDKDAITEDNQKDFFTMMFPKGKLWTRTWNNSIFRNLALKPLTNHSTKEYSRRLEKTKPLLTDKFLEDLYSKIKW